jgi:pyrroline-5-carboxylate reductase
MIRTAPSIMREAARATQRNGYPCVFIRNQSSALGSLRSRTFSAAVQEPEPVTQDSPFDKIAFIGSGRMAEALVAPIVNTGLQPAGKISIFDVHQKTMDRVVEAYDVQGSRSIEECVTGADLICLAVKPQNCEVVFQEIRNMKDKGLCHDNATILSIIAGKPMDSFLPTGIERIARSMPNTPAMIGQGMTVWSATDNICDNTKDKITDVLSSFGKAIYVNDEKFIDMSTAISGSGPAYVFLLMEAMIDAGVHLGFSRDMASTLTHHTLLGSTRFAMETKEHPAILRNNVTSPAGTTASAIYELEDGKFRTVVKDAIWACYRRALEMGGEVSNVGPGRTAPVVVEQRFYKAPKGEMFYENGDLTQPAVYVKGKSVLRK